MEQSIIQFIEKQLIIQQKDKIIISLDGTLMSAVLVKLMQKAEIQFETISCIDNSNKIHSLSISLLAEQLSTPVNLIDTTSISEKLNSDSTISARKRITDLYLNLAADVHNGIVTSNLSYSQWCIDFPHKIYKSLEQIHPLAQLHYSEVKDLARGLLITDTVITREPSHYFSKHTDQQLLGFTYTQLEDFLRSGSPANSITDNLITSKIVRNDWARGYKTLQYPEALMENL